MEELRDILLTFARSGWDLIAVPSQSYLDSTGSKHELVAAIEQANIDCGSCGCEFDPLYKRFFELKELLS